MNKKVKTSWKDITVSDFQSIYLLEREDPEDRLLRLIALVNGITIDDVLNMPLSRLEAHFSDIDFLQAPPREVLVKGSYELEGTRYKINMRELTTAQYIDFKQMVDTYSENLARFLTIFLIPSGHRYGDGYDIEKAAQDIGTMSILDARAVAGFFLTLYGVSTHLFLRSSRRKLARMVRRTKDPKEREMYQNLLNLLLKTPQTRLKNRPRTTGSTS